MAQTSGCFSDFKQNNIYKWQLCARQQLLVLRSGGGEIGYLSLGLVLQHQTEKKQSTTDSKLIHQPFGANKLSKATFKIIKSLAARSGVQPKTPRERCAKGGVYAILIRVPFLKGHLSHQRRPQGRTCCESISNCRPSVLKSRTQPLMFNI